MNTATPAAQAPNADPASEVQMSEDNITTAVMTGAPIEHVRTLEASRPTSEQEIPPVVEPKKEIQPPVETPVAEPPTPEPPAELPPGEIPPAEPLVPEPPAEPVTEPEGHLPERIRIKHLTEVEQAQQHQILAHTREGKSLAEATRLVLGDYTPPTPEPPAKSAIEATSEVVTALETEVAALAKLMDETGESELNTPEYRQASRDYADKLSDLKIARLQAGDALRSEQSSAAAAEQTTLQQQMTARQGVLQAVQAEYPALADRNSPLFKEAVRLSREMKDPTHPNHKLLETAYAPRFIGEQAAKNLKIAPVKVEPPSSVPPIPVLPESATPPLARPTQRTAPPALPPTPEQERSQIQADTDALFFNPTPQNQPRRPGVVYT